MNDLSIEMMLCARLQDDHGHATETLPRQIRVDFGEDDRSGKTDVLIRRAALLESSVAIYDPRHWFDAENRDAVPPCHWGINE
jgi:hypothetical protein